MTIRWLWAGLTLALVWLLDGCGPRPAGDPAKPPKAAGISRSTTPQRAPSPPPTSPPFQGARAPGEAQYPVVTPITVIAGRVVSVNPKLRFVVLDFSLNPLPPIDQRLNVYRQGQKVGEVKISGPARNSHIVADIVAGNAQPGDRVRDD